MPGDDIMAIDLECMEIGPGPDPARQYLYIGDTGTNVVTSRTLASNPTRLYRLPEPDVTGMADAPTTATTTAEVLVYQYAGENPAPNVETMLIDPTSGMLYFGTKQDNKVRLYQVAPSDWTAASPPTLPLTVDINTSGGGNPDLDMATGGKHLAGRHADRHSRRGHRLRLEAASGDGIRRCVQRSAQPADRDSGAGTVGRRTEGRRAIDGRFRSTDRFPDGDEI